MASGTTHRRLSGAATLGLMALLFAVSSQPLPVYAQGSVERYVFYLSAAATGGLGDICVGDRVALDIKAERFLANQRNSGANETTHPPVQVFGVTISGTVGNQEVGTLSPPSAMTSAGGTPPGSAQFVFTAKKPGSTGIEFKGTRIESNWFSQFIQPDRNYLSTELDATVKHCPYVVMIVSQFSVPGPAKIKFMAVLAELHASPDAQGKFTGSGVVTWLGSAGPVGDCGGSVAVGSSTANLTGEQDENGRFNFEVTYTPAQVSLISNCGARNVTVTPDPVHASVASTGGGTRRPQILQGPEPAPGEALVLVNPE